MIDGIGVDIVEIERVATAVARPAFRDRVFTPAEQAYCDAWTTAERYAGRWAAKEAIIKALGRGVTLREMEILPTPEGPPVVRLHGAAAECLAGRRLHLSISHSRDYAVAQAVLERER